MIGGPGSRLYERYRKGGATKASPTPETCEEFAAWLHGFRFKQYCPICSCLMWSRNCRSFNHFGMRYDFELERPVCRD